MASGYVERHDALDDTARAIFERNAKPRAGLDADGRPGGAPPEAEPEPEQPEGEPQPEQEQPEPAEKPEGEEQPEQEAGAEEEQPDEEFVEVTRDGKTENVPVSELVKGYMLHADYTKKTQALATERKQWEGERSAQMQAEQEVVAHVGNLAERLQMELQRITPSPQAMAELRQQDPGEYAAQMQEIARRGALIEEARRQQHMSEQRRLQASVPGERNKLLELMPEDFKDFPAAYTELSAWATGAVAEGGGGLLPEEWGQVVDHRLVRLVQLAFSEAKRRKAGTQATRDGKLRIQKAVSTLPRVRAGAATKPAKTGAERRLADANRNLAANPNSNDALAGVLLARELRARGGGAQ